MLRCVSSVYCLRQLLLNETSRAVWLKTTSSPPFFFVPRLERAGHTNDHAHSVAGQRVRACTPLSKSEGKERLFAVYLALTSLN